MKIAICGSMASAKEMIEAKKNLKKNGVEVHIQHDIEDFAKGEIKNEDKWRKMDFDPFKNYFKIIKKSDAVLVVNIHRKGIKGYIGGNTLIEMAFAHVLDKKIFLLHEIPEVSYKDEIEAMKPIILNGDLSSIKK
jgi:hypothetical protein